MAYPVLNQETFIPPLPPGYMYESSYPAEPPPTYEESVNFQQHQVSQTTPNTSVTPPPAQSGASQTNNQSISGCSLFSRCITKMAVCTLMFFAGLGGLLATIALSPLFGAYIVGSVLCQGCCIFVGVSNDSAKALGILLLVAIAVASLPVIIVSPVFALAAAHRTGKSLLGDDYHPCSLMEWADDKARYYLSADCLRLWLGMSTRHHQCGYSNDTHVHIHHHHYHKHTPRCWRRCG